MEATGVIGNLIAESSQRLSGPLGTTRLRLRNCFRSLFYVADAIVWACLNQCQVHTVADIHRGPRLREECNPETQKLFALRECQHTRAEPHNLARH